VRATTRFRTRRRGLRASRRRRPPTTPRRSASACAAPQFHAAFRRRPTPSSSRSPTSGFGSTTSHGSRCARRTLPPCRSWLTRKRARRSTLRKTSRARSRSARSSPGRDGSSSAQRSASSAASLNGCGASGSSDRRGRSAAITAASSAPASQSGVPGRQRSIRGARRSSSRATSRTAPAPRQPFGVATPLVRERRREPQPARARISRTTSVFASAYCCTYFQSRAARSRFARA
jgi:hypothetical protein